MFAWQGYLRSIAYKHRYRKFAVCGRAGHGYLYEDFATRYVQYDPPSTETNMWMCEGASYDYNDEYDIVIKPDNYLSQKQEFVKFGEEFGGRFGTMGLYDIVIHARSTDKVDTGYRNWDRNHWNKFRELFPNAQVVSIGTRQGALHIDDTYDGRGVTLRELSELMVNSTVLVGPSSGPVHFASLCGLPHVTWSPKNAIGIMSNKDRYERIWNPLKTPVTFIEGSWNPEVKNVVGAVRKYYDN